jgi:hypothetical protein
MDLPAFRRIILPLHLGSCSLYPLSFIPTQAPSDYSYFPYTFSSPTSRKTLYQHRVISLWMWWWRTLTRQQCVVKINRQNRWNFMERSPYCDKCTQPFLFLLLESCISLIYVWKPTNSPIIHSIYWLCMVATTCFGITLPSSGNVSRAFWEMLNWGAVDKILVLWMDVLCLVAWCVVI